MLGDVCGRIEGADVDVVTKPLVRIRVSAESLAWRHRIRWPCFPATTWRSRPWRQLGARADLAEATDAINHYQVDRVLDAVVSRQTAPSAIGVLGLSYKPDTPVVEQSQGLLLVERLVSRGYHVLARSKGDGDRAETALVSNSRPCPRPRAALKRRRSW
jgi:UDPglucose 6-dehydrogenase